MSRVFYKWKSEKTYATVTFDGLGISAFDLKREIMMGAKKLGRGTDFELATFNAATNEEYADDKFEIPRNTEIIVKRVPPNGKLTAQRYLTGGPSLSEKSSANKGASHYGGGGAGYASSNRPPPFSSINKPGSETTLMEGLTEEEKIQAMLKQNEELVENQLKNMDGVRGGMPQRGNFRGRGGFNPSFRSNLDSFGQKIPPPPGYICYRCLGKDHFIHDCPTHGNTEFDKPKLKRTTGIPKAFLVKVEQTERDKGNVMVTTGGDLVVAAPNSEAWDKHVGMAKTVVGPDLDGVEIPNDLKCFICSKLISDAVMAPCCGTSFCDDCIRQSMFENKESQQRMNCPSCKREQHPDNCTSNEHVRQKVNSFLREVARKQKLTVSSASSLPSLNGSSELKATDKSLVNGTFSESITAKSASLSPEISNKQVNLSTISQPTTTTTSSSSSASTLSAPFNLAGQKRARSSPNVSNANLPGMPPFPFPHHMMNGMPPMMMPPFGIPPMMMPPMMGMPPMIMPPFGVPPNNNPNSNKNNGSKRSRRHN